MEKFETAELRINGSGIALLRCGYAYRRLNFQEIESLTIKKGSVVNNAGIIFCLGVLLVLSSFIIFIYTNPINFPDVQLGVRGGKALGYFIIMVAGLLCFGGILIYQALKKDYVLTITTNAFNQTYPLSEIRKNNELDNLILYLKDKTGKKLKVETRELIKVVNN